MKPYQKSALVLVLLTGSIARADLVSKISEDSAQRLKTILKKPVAQDQPALKDAEESAEQVAKKQDVNLAEGHYLCAATLAKRKQAIPQARKFVIHLEKALAGGYRIKQCHADLGQIYLAAGDASRAASHLSKVEAERPDLRLKLARVMMVQNRRADARTYAESAESELKKQVAGTKPGSPEELNWLAALEFLERFDEAIKYLEGRIGLSRSGYAKKTLSQVLVAKYDAAIRVSKAVGPDELDLVIRAVREDADNREAMERLLLFLPGARKRPKLKPEFDPLARIKASKMSAHGHLVVGSVLASKGDNEAAIQQLQRAYVRDPLNTAVLNNYASFLSRARPPRLKQAIRIANELVALAPNKLEFRETRGQIHLLRRDWRAAKLDLEAALPVLGAYPELHRGLVKTYHELGSVAQANRHRAILEQFQRRKSPRK